MHKVYHACNAYCYSIYKYIYTGLTVTRGGMTILHDGLTVTGGLTINTNGLHVTGGVTVHSSGMIMYMCIFRVYHCIYRCYLYALFRSLLSLFDFMHLDSTSLLYTHIYYIFSCIYRFICPPRRHDHRQRALRRAWRAHSDQWGSGGDRRVYSRGWRTCSAAGRHTGAVND